jgi:hypothetical protein
MYLEELRESEAYQEWLDREWMEDSPEAFEEWLEYGDDDPEDDV